MPTSSHHGAETHGAIAPMANARRSLCSGLIIFETTDSASNVLVGIRYLHVDETVRRQRERIEVHGESAVWRARTG